MHGSQRAWRGGLHGQYCTAAEPTHLYGRMTTHCCSALQLQAAAAGVLRWPCCAQQRPAEVRTDGRSAKEGPDELLRARKA
jgi:hypothetical protein